MASTVILQPNRTARAVAILGAAPPVEMLHSAKFHTKDKIKSNPQPRVRGQIVANSGLILVFRGKP